MCFKSYHYPIILDQNFNITNLRYLDHLFSFCLEYNITPICLRSTLIENENKNMSTSTKAKNMAYSTFSVTLMLDEKAKFFSATCTYGISVDNLLVIKACPRNVFLKKLSIYEKVLVSKSFTLILTFEKDDCSSAFGDAVISQCL